MDTRKLKYFLAVVDHDGFNRAAEHLLIAQPSLSQTIAGPGEGTRGAALPPHRPPGCAERGGQGTRRTGTPGDAGPRRGQSAVQALRGVRSGRLDMITMPSPGIEPLTSMIAAFTTAAPVGASQRQCRVHAEEVIESVRSGSTEIGLAGSSTSHPGAGRPGAGLERQPLILIVNPQADTFGPGDGHPAGGPGRAPADRQPARITDALARRRCAGPRHQHRNRRRGGAPDLDPAAGAGGRRATR